MEFSPSFGSFTLQPLIETIITPSLGSTEQHLASLEKEALNGGEHLPEHKQDLYKAMVRQGVNQIRLQIAKMRSEGKKEYEINRAVKVLITNFKTSNVSFIEKNQLWSNAKEQVKSNFHHTSNNINSLNSNFGRIKRLDFDDDEDIEGEQLPLVDMEVKKTQFARCVQMSMDPESPYGTNICLAHHSKGLSEEEKKDLNDFEPNAIKGTVINNLAVVPVLISKAVNTVIGATKVLALSAMSEAALTIDPTNYDTRMKEMRSALKGENAEFNHAMKEVTPTWVLSAKETLAGWDHRLDQFDKGLQNKYRTVPGIVKEGIVGTAEIAVGITSGFVIKGTVRLVKKIATRAPNVKEYRINDSTSTYSYANEKGQTIVVKETAKTYYQPPQHAHKPFNGKTVDGKPASRTSTSSHTLLIENKRLLSNLKQTPILHPENLSDVTYIATNSIMRKGSNIIPFSYANSNLLPNTPYITKMVVNGGSTPPDHPLTGRGSLINNGPQSTLTESINKPAENPKVQPKMSERINAEYEKLVDYYKNSPGQSFLGSCEKDRLMRQAIAKVLPPMVKPEGFPETIMQFRRRKTTQQSDLLKSPSFNYLQIEKAIIFEIEHIDKFKGRIREVINFAKNKDCERIFLTYAGNYGFQADVAIYLNQYDCILAVDKLEVAINANAHEYALIEIATSQAKKETHIVRSNVIRGITDKIIQKMSVKKDHLIEQVSLTANEPSHQSLPAALSDVESFIHPKMSESALLIEERITHVCSKQVGARSASFQTLRDNCYGFSIRIANLCNDAIQNHPLASKSAEILIQRFEELVKEMEHELPSVLWKSIDTESFKPIIKRFRDNFEISSYFLSDQLLFPKAWNLQQFLSFLDCKGLSKGLSLNEVQSLKNVMMKEYQSRYTGPKNTASEHFTDLYWSIYTLKSLAKDNNLQYLNPFFLKVRVEELNAKLFHYQEIARLDPNLSKSTPLRITKIPPKEVEAIKAEYEELFRANESRLKDYSDNFVKIERDKLLFEALSKVVPTKLKPGNFPETYLQFKKRSSEKQSSFPYHTVFNYLQVEKGIIFEIKFSPGKTIQRIREMIDFAKKKDCERVFFTFSASQKTYKFPLVSYFYANDILVSVDKLATSANADADMFPVLEIFMGGPKQPTSPKPILKAENTGLRPLVLREDLSQAVATLAKKTTVLSCAAPKGPSISIIAKVKKFVQDEFGGGKLPIDRDFIVDLFEKIGYSKVPGGKGSHEKWRKANCKMVIIPQGNNVIKGTVRLVKKIATRAPKLKEYRTNDSTSTYSYVNEKGHTVVVKETAKTYYQPPQSAHKPFNGKTVDGKSASRTSSQPLKLENKRSLPALNQNPILQPRRLNDITYIAANSIVRKGLSINHSSNANSNVWPDTQFITKMVVNEDSIPPANNLTGRGSLMSDGSQNVPTKSTPSRPTLKAENTGLRPLLFNEDLSKAKGSGHLSGDLQAKSPLHSEKSVGDAILITQSAMRVPESMEGIPQWIDVEYPLNNYVTVYRETSQATPLEQFIRKTISSPYTISEIKPPFSGNTIHKIYDALDGRPLGVVKEIITTGTGVSGFIPEVVAQSILRGENFKKAFFLPIRDIGLAETVNRSKKGLLMYPHFSEYTLEYFFQNNMPIPARKVGQIGGEIGAVESTLQIAELYLAARGMSLFFMSELCISLIKKAGLHTSLSAARVEMFTNDMKLNPGRAGLVHGDYYPSNLLIDKKGNIAVIDTGKLMESVNRIGMPHGMPAFDQQQMLVAMDVLGSCYGFSQSKMDLIRSEYLRGYHEMMPREAISESAALFARLNFEFMGIYQLFETKASMELIQLNLERMNRLFGQTPVRSGTKAKVTEKKKQPAPALLAERINQLEAPVYFPPMPELKEMSLEEVHKIWSQNQEILLGMIAKEHIPLFGLHGTSYLGSKYIKNGLMQSTEGDILWVAGITEKKNPMKQLGGLSAIIEKSTGYIGREGELFIVDTTNAVRTGEKFLLGCLSLTLDTPQQSNLLNQMRNLPYVDQLHVPLDSQASKLIKGSLLEKETLYSSYDLELLEKNIETKEWAILAKRLKVQEYMLSIFEKLGVIQNFTSAPWTGYQEAGRKLLEPKQKMRTSPKQSIEKSVQPVTGTAYLADHMIANIAENDRLAARPKAIAFSLSHSHRDSYIPEVHQVMELMDKLTHQGVEGSVFRTMTNNARILTSTFTDYTTMSGLGVGREEDVWEHVIRKTYPYFNVAKSELTSSSRMQTIKLTSQIDRRIIVNKFGFGGAPIVNQMKGLDFAKSLSSDLIEVPSIIGFGKYQFHYFIAESSIEGDSIAAMMMNIGQAKTPEKRSMDCLEAAIGLYRMGRANGGLVYKGLLRPTKEKALDRVLALDTQQLESDAVSVSRLLWDKGIHVPIKMDRIYSLAKAFRKKPGDLSYAYGNFNLNQWKMTEDGEIGLVWLEGLTTSFDGALNPLEHPLSDYYRFMYQVIDSAGIAHGLNIFEIKTLRNAFRNGFETVFDTSIFSKEAHQFYETAARLNGFSMMNLNKYVNGETEQQLELMKALAHDLKNLL